MRIGNKNLRNTDIIEYNHGKMIAVIDDIMINVSKINHKKWNISIRDKEGIVMLNEDINKHNISETLDYLSNKVF